MPKQTQKTHILIRFLGDCLCLFLVLTFLLQASLLYLAQREIVLPDFFKEYLLSILSTSEHRIDAEKITLNRLTHFSVSRVKIFQKNSREEFLKINRLYGHFNLPQQKILGGKPKLKLGMRGTELWSPSAISKAGLPHRFISEGRLELEYKNDTLYVSSLLGKWGKTKIIAHGEIPAYLCVPAKKSSESKPLNPSHKNAENGFANFIKTLEQIEDFEELYKLDGKFNLIAEFNYNETSKNLEILTSLSCPHYEAPIEEIYLDEIILEALLKFNLETNCLFADKPPKIFAKKLYGSYGNGILETWNFSLQNLEINSDLNLKITPAKNYLNETKISKIECLAEKLQADNFVHGKFELKNLNAELLEINEALQQKKITLRGNANGFNSSAEFKISHNLKTEKTRLSLKTEIDFLTLTKIPSLSGLLSDEIHQLKFLDKIIFNGEIKISDLKDFEALNYQVESGSFEWKMLHGNALYSTGTITKENVNISIAKAIGENYCSNLRLFSELKPQGFYRIQAFGSIANPGALDEYLDWFWWRIWKNLKLAPAKNAPRADVDVYGNWGGTPGGERVYAAIAGENALGGGVLVDKVRLRAVAEPEFISAFDMGFERGENKVTGTLLWNYTPYPNSKLKDFRAAFSGTMPPHDIFKVVGEGLPEVFENLLIREAPASADVKVFFSGDKQLYPQQREMVEVLVKDGNGDFEFLGIKAKDFTGKINYDTGNVNVNFGSKCENGILAGDIKVKFAPNFEINGTQLFFNLWLRDLPQEFLGNTLKTLNSTLNFKDQENKTQAAENLNPSPKNEGLISANFTGYMTLPSLKSLSGQGNFELYNPNLFQLEIFGKFSQFLNKIKIPITSFDMTNATSNFKIKNEEISLENLKIFGETGEIFGSLSINLNDEKLKGKVSFVNKRFTEIPILGNFVEFVSKPIKLIPIKIFGSLDQIEWRLLPFGNKDE